MPQSAFRIVALLILTLTSLPFIAAGHDDTWIMLFAGETLGQGPWFLNHNGAPQEVSTSVLGALLAGLAALIATPGYEYAIWKFAAWLPAMFAGVLLFDAVRRHCGTFAGYYWILVLACIPQWHNWAWGGLESGLFWLCSLMFALALAGWSQQPDWRSGWKVAALAVMLPLTRADALWAPLILLCAAPLTVSSNIRLRLAPGLFASAATLAFHGLRRWLSGQWLPSPAYAKAALSPEGVQQGLNYMYQFHTQTPLHMAMAITLPLSLWGLIRLLSSLRAANARRPGLFEWASLLVLVIDASTVIVGGDWMGHHRFAIRSLPLKILLLALAADMAFKWLSAQHPGRLLRNLSYGTCTVVALTGWQADGIVEKPGLFRSASQISEDIPLSLNLIDYMQAANIPARRDTLTLLPWLEQDLPRLVEQARRDGALPLVVATYQAGYFAREVRHRFNANEVLFVDLAGLTERRIGSLPGERTALGLSEGVFRWATTIAQGNGALGHFMADCRPDVVYVIWASPNATRLMASAGYAASYRQVVPINGQLHGAFIFTAPATAQAVKCAALTGAAANPGFRY